VTRAIPRAANLRLAAALLAIQGLQLYVLPAVLLPRSRWWGLLLVALLPAGHTVLSLTHEAVHRIFHPSERVNRLAGRVLAVVFGASFDVYRTVHLMHHKFNRTERERVEVYGWRGRTGWRARAAFYFDLLGGTYFSQIVGLALLPFLPGDAWRAHLRKRPDDPNSYVRRALGAMAAPKTLAAIRQDAIALAIVHGSAFGLYGRAWPMLLGAMAARALFVSMLNYVYHYGSPLDDVLHGYNLRLPMPLSRVLLHFNLHGVHHADPSLPWMALPAAFRQSARGFDAPLGAAALRQLRGPVHAHEIHARHGAALTPKRSSSSSIGRAHTSSGR
jgi:fatty acid desaturase